MYLLRFTEQPYIVRGKGTHIEKEPQSVRGKVTHGKKAAQFMSSGVKFYFNSIYLGEFLYQMKIKVILEYGVKKNL